MRTPRRKPGAKRGRAAEAEIGVRGIPAHETHGQLEARVDVVVIGVSRGTRELSLALPKALVFLASSALFFRAQLGPRGGLLDVVRARCVPRGGLRRCVGLFVLCGGRTGREEQRQCGDESSSDEIAMGVRHAPIGAAEVPTD